MAIDGVGKNSGGTVKKLELTDEQKELLKKAQAKNGEYMYKLPEAIASIGKASTDIVKLLSTEAGTVALQLAGYNAKDILDGKVKVKIDEIRIPAETWNSYAEPLGGNPVTNYIDVISAMNSISDYSVKGQDIQVKISQVSDEAAKAADAKQKAADENGGESFGL